MTIMRKTLASPDVLTGPELRKALGISTPTYYRWLREGKLKGTRAGRDWRFPRALVDELLRSGSATSETRDAIKAWTSELLAAGVHSKDIDPMVTAAARPGDTLARLVLRHAHARRATDVHVEPAAGGFCVRERVDGSLAPAGRTLAPGAAADLLQAVRDMAGFPPGASTLPASGRFFADIGGHTIDVRAATYPTAAGPSLCLSLLDPATLIPRLDDLGLPKNILAAIRAAVSRPGLFIVNGRAGSGKTTTLYSLLLDLARPELKVMTAEDPVELNFEGIQQSAVGQPGGPSFADAIRAMAHSNVDIAMAAEMRDGESMRAILTLATTGRRALTVLHAPDAVAALHRFIQVSEVEPALFAENISGILNQRLARKPCPACISPAKLTAGEAHELGLSAKDVGRKVIASAGCAKCRKTGVRGATVVADLLTITPALRKAIEARAGVDELRAAMPDSFRPLRDEVIGKMFACELTPAEAIRVVNG